MKKQNGHISEERLSLYFDDEITVFEKKVIEQHLQECDYCRRRLAEINQLHEIVRQSPEPLLKKDLWASINNQIESSPSREHSWGNYKKWVAAAAIVLLALTGGWWLLGEQFNVIEKDSLPITSINQYAFDYGFYLSGLDSPELMKQFNNGYKRQKIELAGMTESSDIRKGLALLNNLPQNFFLESAYLLESACCQCQQFTLKHNEKQITVFKQPKKHPAEFTGFHKKHTKIDSTDCSKVETEHYMALTFDSGDSKYVVVGEQQDPMVPKIMNQLTKEH